MRWFLAILLLLSPLAALAAEPLCGDAVGAAEQRYNVPSGLLQAIALSESGRWDKQARVTVAWPWAVTSGADSFFAPDKQSAIATVRRLQREGRRNIDVGCMQVNLMHHPDAFADLDSAFDPEVNAGYGARFLSGLREATRSWSRAVERYHSADPDRGRSYRDRVYDRWHAVQKAGSAVIGPGVRGTTVHRPPLREAAAASSLFSNAGPRWRLTPVRIGQSLWSDRPAMPLVMRGRPLAPLGKRPTTPKAPSAGG